MDTDPVQLLSLNSYDLLGQLKSKKTGGTDITGATALQKIDFTYNIRGWLKGINDIGGLNTGENDLFAFSINYNDVPGNNVNDQVMPLFNGNIAETSWRSATDNVLRRYGYRYDQLNRLLNAYYQKPGSAISLTSSYDESAQYDKNGNITRMERSGEYDDEVYALAMDELEYFYDPVEKNRLLKVADHTNQPAGFKDSPDNDTDDYTYDGYGNMTADRNKGITSITYNHQNLPVEIVFGNLVNTKIRYLYEAAGKKVQKVVRQQVFDGSAIVTETTATDYLGGFHYAKGKLQHFPTAEGYVSVTYDKRNISLRYFNYVYQYKDHLGNVRLSYGAKPGTQTPEIMEESHYYPFRDAAPQL
ncbi:hypothetical protein CHU92_00280 [Flavobacterium cyanobacteriorum]|uniref:Type IV secretion protein Rhs n=1 Tax=Flavobacterium cyanobacteriorum TaxID=2022802 RepID=A0A256A7Q5_9FLAO|nr:hypothetical protein [Flavobacterium cyanobacteriorum]OYQ49703.1 hypothetical protein CHU92_00280 [Flavobacterium cyanobacteriorum]